MTLWRVFWIGKVVTTLSVIRFPSSVAVIKLRKMRHFVIDHEDNKKSTLVTTGLLEGQPNNDQSKPVHLGQLIRQKVKSKERFCSFELFPTADVTVYQRFFKETQKCEPLFYSLTWHRNTALNVEHFPALKCVENFPPNTLLHCTAKSLKFADLEMILNRALVLDIINIFALQGDTDTEYGDFSHASDLVTYIRERFGHQFSICVAGYPEMHPKSPSKKLDLFYLKKKVDAGADFIITQMFFESQLFIKFVQDCRDVGITIPIIPGIYPFTSAKLLRKMSSLCQVKIPSWIEESLQPIEDDVGAVRKLGMDISSRIVREIEESGTSYGFHVFCLNRFHTAEEFCHRFNSETEKCTKNNKK